jgi:hypothetical protein
MCEHQPRCPEARISDRPPARAIHRCLERPYRPAIVGGRAQENRAYVRNLLKTKQPEFAATLDLIARDLLAEQFAVAGTACRPQSDA